MLNCLAHDVRLEKGAELLGFIERKGYETIHNFYGIDPNKLYKL